MTGLNALDEQTVSRIVGDPRFHELRRGRRRLGGLLTIVMCAIYFGYLLAASLAPELASQRLGSALTLGMVAGVFVILSAVVLTAIYVWRANHDFDRRVEALCGSGR